MVLFNLFFCCRRKQAEEEEKLRRKEKFRWVSENDVYILLEFHWFLSLVRLTRTHWPLCKNWIFSEDIITDPLIHVD